MFSETFDHDHLDHTRRRARPRPSGPLAALVLAGVAGSLLSLSCSPSSPADPGRTQGAIAVSVASTGGGQPASFIVRLDGGSAQSVSPDGSVTFGSLAPGNYEVELTVPSNCTVSGSATRTVGVQEGATSSVAFSVSCTAPTTGDLQVSAATGGSDLDPNGYAVSVDGGPEQTIGINGSTSFSDLGPGPHDVELTDVSANCAVDGENPRTVDVVAGELAATTFDVTCSSTVGGLTVTVTTSGEAQDADGYSVVLDGGVDIELIDTDPPGNVATFTGLNPGSHSLALQNVAANCTVTSPNPTSADVVAGQTTDVSFTVDCAQLTGDIQVNVSTSGSEPDPNGYGVSVDGGSPLSIGINGSRTFQDVVIGEHEVQLSGVASNCAVQGENPRTVDVNQNQTTQVSFSVVCSATTGQIQVSVTTTGDDLDGDGYTVNRDGGTAIQQVTVNGSTTFTGVTPGSHDLELQNVAANCEVTSANPTSTTVTAGATANVSFTVECTRTTGDIRVITSSTGSPPDANGYTVSVDGGAGRAIGINDEELFLDLQAGDHSVTLSGVAAQCAISGSATRTVSVSANQETQETFNVTCDPLAGDIQVNVSTSGEDPDTGYVITLDGADARAVGTNGSTTYTNVPTGNHQVAIGGIAGNCNVSGANPRSVNLADEETEVVNFNVTCVGLTGDLEVNTSTTGDPGDLDPNGYTVTVDGGSSRSIGLNDTETYQDLADGLHTVELTGLAPNCTVSGSNPRDVDVPANSTGSTTFSVNCATTTGSIEVDVSTSGQDQDDAYTVTLDGGGGQAVAGTGTVTFTDVSPGSHDVELTEVASNCTVTETNPQSVDVTAGNTTNVSFTVTCAQLTGDLTVNTTTTGDAGDLDPDGYTVTVDGGGARSIGLNDTDTYLDVAAGDHSVELTDLAGNCSVAGDNPRTVNVPADGTGSTTFDVTCEPTTGAIEVSTATSGANAPDPDGYTVTLNGGDSRSIDDGNPVTYGDLAPATYTVELSGADGTCTITSANPVTPTVTAGQTEPVGFTVDCP